MTAQIPDSIIYDDHKYSIAALENELPFNPEDYGLNPVPIDTSCWRGYYCDYIIKDKKLFLQELNVGLDESEPPEVLGYKPDPGSSIIAAKYPGLDLAINYSGGMIATSELVKGFYVHMGFQPPFCFEKVIEFIFEDGDLSIVTDHSQKMRKIREKINGARESYSENMMEFIENAFSLFYDDKWW
ncbi:MAG: hypothetical protein ACQEQF_10100 [Bacillota bacterium]